MDLNLFFGEVACKLQLGTLLSSPTRVQGGLTHTMYRLNTADETYVAKLLNPGIMKRPTAIGNYSIADSLECVLEKNNIPIVPSLTFGGTKMQMLEGQYFYLYKWYDGKALKGEEITELHCRKISEVLSRIHRIDAKSQQYRRSPINVDWDSYIDLAQRQHSPISPLLAASKELLYASQNNGNFAVQHVPPALAICHNDMDSKNVLWHNQDFKLIDLECLGYSNPYIELFELALCWSGYEQCKIDFVLFKAFIDAYFVDSSKPDISCESLYYSNYSRLEWLEYNVKRALLIECGTAEEQALGVQQVKETIAHVIYYDSVRDKILSCLSQMFL